MKNVLAISCLALSVSCVNTMTMTPKIAQEAESNLPLLDQYETKGMARGERVEVEAHFLFNPCINNVVKIPERAPSVQEFKFGGHDFGSAGLATNGFSQNGCRLNFESAWSPKQVNFLNLTGSTQIVGRDYTLIVIYKGDSLAVYNHNTGANSAVKAASQIFQITRSNQGALVRSFASETNRALDFNDVSTAKLSGNFSSASIMGVAKYDKGTNKVLSTMYIGNQKKDGNQLLHSSSTPSNSSLVRDFKLTSLEMTLGDTEKQGLVYFAAYSEVLSDEDTMIALCRAAYVAAKTGDNSHMDNLGKACVQ